MWNYINREKLLRLELAFVFHATMIFYFYGVNRIRLLMQTCHFSASAVNTQEVIGNIYVVFSGKGELSRSCPQAFGLISCVCNSPHDHYAIHPICLSLSLPRTKFSDGAKAEHNADSRLIYFDFLVLSDSNHNDGCIKVYFQIKWNCEWSGL